MFGGLGRRGARVSDRVQGGREVCGGAGQVHVLVPYRGPGSRSPAVGGRGAGSFTGTAVRGTLSHVTVVVGHDLAFKTTRDRTSLHTFFVAGLGRTLDRAKRRFEMGCLINLFSVAS